MLPLFIAFALATRVHDRPASATSLPVSLEHIRDGLQRTPALRLDAPMPEPTFRVEVVQHPYFVEVPFSWRWADGSGASPAPIAAPGGTPPLIQVDVLPWIRSARHAYEQHAASADVQRAIAEFCATHACRPE